MKHPTRPSEIVFGVISHYYGEDDIMFVINLIILLGKWFINKCKTNDTPISLASFINLVKDKLKAIRVSHILNNNFESFDMKFGVLYNKL